MNCASVREVLPEFALGVTPARETSDVELHVETCAACRKEAIDLQRAVAAFGYAVAPTEPPVPELEARVVQAVHRVATRPARRRTARRTGITLLAAALIVGALGTGAVLANRAERSRLQSERAQLETQQMLERFGDVVSSARFADPGTEVYLGALDNGRGQGTGAALTVVSPSERDQAIVIVNGLPPDAPPLTVRLVDGRGSVLTLGTIERLDSAGSATLARVVRRNLEGYVDVVARSADGQVILRGSLEANASVSSPSP